ELGAIDRHHAAAAARSQRLCRQRQQPVRTRFPRGCHSRGSHARPHGRSRRRTLRRRCSPLGACLHREAPLHARRTCPVPADDPRPRSKKSKARKKMIALLGWLGKNTIIVAILIPPMMFACWAFHNRPAVQHLLWVVVLLKLVTPP